MSLANRQSLPDQQAGGKHLKNKQAFEAPVKIKAVFTILNDKGLHTRPATELVKAASRFKARAHLTYQGITVNAKSLLGILMLAAARGAKIAIEAEGPDATEMVNAILELARGRFNIRY